MQTLPLHRQINIQTPAKNITQLELINQLRRENSILKQQISNLVSHSNSRNQGTVTPHINGQQVATMPVSARGQLCNMEDEVEVAYRNKMQKLKMKRMQQSTPTSPRVSCSSPTHRRIQQEGLWACKNQTFYSPRAQPMIISKDNEGKFFRVKEQQRMSVEKVQNVQKVFKEIFINYQNRPQNSNHCNARLSPSHYYPKLTFTPSHSRANSNITYSNNHQLQQPTERKCQPINIPKTFKKLQPYKPQTNKSIGKYQSASSKQLLIAVQPQLRLKQQAPMIIPKGNVYFQDAQAMPNVKDQRKVVEVNNPIDQLQNRGDSRLSIEMSLRRMKSNRTLKYDIYMQEQRQR